MDGIANPMRQPDDAVGFVQQQRPGIGCHRATVKTPRNLAALKSLQRLLQSVGIGLALLLSVCGCVKYTFTDSARPMH